MPPAADARTESATRSAEAWSGQDPVRFGEFCEEDASLVVNGAASTGRSTIVETARSYMEAFPDMVVRLDSLREDQGATVFHWTWTGTDTGPGGTGRAVRLRGDERWTFGPNGLLMTSDGHFDDGEYQRQLRGQADVGPRSAERAGEPVRRARIDEACWRMAVRRPQQDRTSSGERTREVATTAMTRETRSILLACTPH